jgi:hypothetical protein
MCRWIMISVLLGLLCWPPEAPAQASYDRTVPTARGLAAWWRVMPGVSGGARLYDLVGQAHCTLTNGPSWSTTTRPGGLGEIRLDGTDDYLSCLPPALSGGEYTWMTWAKVSTFSRSWLLNSTYPSGHKLQINLDGGNWAGNHSALSFQINEFYTNNVGAGNSLPSPGPWMHLAITMSVSRNQSIGYLNGVQTGTGNMETDPFGGTGISFSIATYIGETPALSLDDYRVYTRVLSAAEVQQCYQASRLGDVAALRPPSLMGFLAAAAARGNFLPFFGPQP